MIKRLFLLHSLCLIAIAGLAQDYTRSTLFGVGFSNQLDTYLSPMEYTGFQLSFLTARERMTHWADGNLSFQSLLQGAFSHTKNPARTATAWGGRLAYDAGWHYHWRLSD